MFQRLKSKVRERKREREQNETGIILNLRIFKNYQKKKIKNSFKFITHFPAIFTPPWVKLAIVFVLHFFFDLN